MEIQQKQPSRGVLGKRCSENMQQIYRRTPMSNCELNKLHFSMCVLLHMRFSACIFSEHIFLRIPPDVCFWYRLFPTLSSCIWKGVSLHVVETKWEAKSFHKNFHYVLEMGPGVERKRHYILPWTNQVTSGPKKRSGISRVFKKNHRSWFVTI